MIRREERIGGQELSHYLLPKGNVQISFSGGRTSAYMLHQIAEANGGIPERCKVVFANTGREMPQTLDFVQEVSDRWSIPVDWVEYSDTAPRFVLVSHNSASRDGEPFESLVKRRKFLPNQKMRFCTGDLKLKPSARYLVSLGWRQWVAALGIRADEAQRVKREPQQERWQRWYPLADAGVSKRDVMAFWLRQPFDLRLANVNGKTPLGNCDGCFLKSESILSMLARDYPNRHAWWERIETETTEATTAAAARFNDKYTRKRLREFVERQGDWIFNTEGALCQSDDGECMA
jgi:3'-phosphoadenosine 5'-phosphosulfate sulfotransferase (PAPS reductase)/FAD synthetase